MKCLGNNIEILRIEKETKLRVTMIIGMERKKISKKRKVD